MATDYQTYPTFHDAVAARDALQGWDDAEVGQIYLPDHEDADGEGNVWVLRCSGTEEQGEYLRTDGQVR